MNKLTHLNTIAEYTACKTVAFRLSQDAFLSVNLLKQIPSMRRGLYVTIIRNQPKGYNLSKSWWVRGGGK